MMFTKNIRRNIFLTLVLGLVVSVTQALNEVSYPLPGGSQWPVDVQFSPNGQYLATANSNDVSMFNVGVGGALSEGLIPIFSPFLNSS